MSAIPEFRKRRQRAEENAEDFANSLKNLAKSCSFQSDVDQELVWQFTSGLRSEKVQNFLDSHQDYTFEKAVGVAIGYELGKSEQASDTSASSLGTDKSQFDEIMVDGLVAKKAIVGGAGNYIDRRHNPDKTNMLQLSKEMRESAAGPQKTSIKFQNSDMGENPVIGLRSTIIDDSTSDKGSTSDATASDKNENP